jgi:crotonobetainyl-CoA:carnitine CoA-transferase CaiB-like acyl-CoA transferase
VADQLQALGIEAVPVADFGDVFSDPQLAARHHFIELEHPRMGPGAYEHNGFRLSVAPATYDRPSPLLGQHTDEVLGDILGLSAAKREALAADGVLD